MDYSELKVDGIYRLSADVKNPHADKRYKRQPNMESVWKKGTRFIARDESWEHDYGGDQGVVRVTWFKLEWLDCQFGSLYAIPVREKERMTDCGEVNDARATAIMEALEPAEEDYSAFLVRVGLKDGGSRIVLQRLCEKGIVTRAQIEDEYNTWINEPDE